MVTVRSARLQKAFTPEAIRLYVFCAIAAALLTVFGLLAEQVTDGDTAAFDQTMLMMFRDAAAPAVPLGPPWMLEAIRDITALGSFSVLGALVLGVVLHLVFTGSRRTAILVAVSVVGGSALSTLLKLLFDRPRPDLTGAVEVFSSSFPSSHATVSAVVYLTIGVILAERAKTWPARLLYFFGAILLTGAVGFSRLYLGVHFPTDILAGWSLGAAWALICLIASHALRSRGHLADTASPGRST